MPIAAIVPNTVADIAEISAIIKVLVNAFIIWAFWKSRWYHLNVNPDQTDLLFESLNENTINTAIGAYKKMYIRYVYTFDKAFIS